MPADVKTSTTQDGNELMEVSLPNGLEGKKKQKPPTEPSATLHEFYQFCSPLERIMLVIAVIGSAGTGVAQPLMLLAFQSLFEGFSTGMTLGGALISHEKMLEMLTIMLVLGGAMWVGQLIGVFCVEYVTASQMLKLKQLYLKAVLRQEVGWYDTSNPEELSTQYAEAMVKVQKGFKSQSQIFMGLGYGTGGLVLAFLPSIGNAEVTGVTLATVPLLIVAACGMMYIMENGSKQVSKAYSQAGGVATECLFSMRTIVSFGLESKFEGRYSGALARVRRTTIVNSTLFMCGGGVALSSYLVMMATAIVYGAFRLAGEIESSQFPLIVNDSASQTVVHFCADDDGGLANFSLGQPCAQPVYMSCKLGGDIAMSGDTPLSAIADATPGFSVPPGYGNYSLLAALNFESVSQFSSYVKEAAPPEYVDDYDNDDYYACTIPGANIILAIFAVMMMGEGFSMAGQPAQHFSLGRQAAAKVLKIISRVPSIDSFSEEGAKPSSVQGAIEVKDVVFAYPTAPDKSVCSGYSLSIGAGQTVALCGPSGSGKSTIIALLERFYDPQGGVVTLDGTDLKALNVRWLRSQIGYVGQEPVLFQGTVTQNIAYGKPTDATQEEVEEAAKMANAHGFITSNLAFGYGTDVGLKGGKLSGGQKQRVAIARAIIKKPAVMLLDEATSALDNENERIVQAALDELMAKQKRTTVVIAHRLSTIRNADKIAVVSEGRIVEQGSHDELLALQGMYTSLVMAA